MPYCPFLELECIQITNDFYLMDDRSVDYPGLLGQLNEESEDSIMEGSDSRRSFGMFSPMFSYSSDQLYLEITNLDSGTVYANLDNATNQVYAIWSTINIGDGWTVETDVWPTDPTSMPFTVQTLDRQSLFLWAEDWTGVTTNGNTTPNWWLWENFGPLWSTLYDTNLDSQGYTYAYDYENNIDPNPIQFTIALTNNYVNTNFITIPFNIATGIPYYTAVLIDDTNFADASWQTYAGSNVMVTLGASNTTYDVWIGLRGHPDTTEQEWQGVQITLDTVPPTVTITNPVTSVVTQPRIQLQGYASERLSAVTYDLTNALGLVTNQAAFVTSESIDTNTATIAADYFQGYDIPLTNGANTITLHVTDLAGNTTITNLSFTLDYSGKTNPPALAISWPPSNSVVAGTNFTLSGTVDDDTASVTVTGPGVTNTAVVQRGGKFTLANLPLPNPTNTFTVTATDAVGNSTSMTWTLFQGATSVTIDQLSADSLSQSQATLTGTVNTGGLDVWVNGVKATVSGGTWEADYVPVTKSSGIGEFDVSLYSSGTTSLVQAVQSSVVTLPPTVEAASYLRVYSETYSGPCGQFPHGQIIYEAWQLGVGGSLVNTIWDTLPGRPTGTTETEFGPDSIPVSPWPSVHTEAGFSQRQSDTDCSSVNNGHYTTYNSFSDYQSTGIRLDAGGSLDGSYKLIRLTAQFLYGDILLNPYLNGIISFGQLWMPTATNSGVGEVYVMRRSGSTTTFTFGTFGLPGISMTNIHAEEVTLKILSGTNDVTGQTNSIIVGQQINLSCQFSLTNAPVTSYSWSVPGYAISNYVVDVNAGTVFSNFSKADSKVAFYWADG